MTPRPIDAAERSGRAGLLVFLALVLTSSLFAAPTLAAHHDFGHTHPEDAPKHVHAITGLLSAVASTGVVGVAVVFLPLFNLSLTFASEQCRRIFDISCAIRAPPLPLS